MKQNNTNCKSNKLREFSIMKYKLFLSDDVKYEANSFWNERSRKKNIKQYRQVTIIPQQFRSTQM